MSTLLDVFLNLFKWLFEKLTGAPFEGGVGLDLADEGGFYE